MVNDKKIGLLKYGIYIYFQNKSSKLDKCPNYRDIEHSNSCILEMNKDH